MSVFAAAPEPPIRLQLAAPPVLDFAPAPQAFASLPCPAHVTMEVFGHGQLQWRHMRMLLRASNPSTHAQTTLGQLKRKAPDGAYWRIRSTAQVSELPNERRVRLEMRQSSGALQLTGGLEALDAELAPAAGFGKRMVRRFGPTLAMRWQPVRMLRHRRLNALSASARLWPTTAEGEVWDLTADARAGFRARLPGSPTFWGQAAIRHFAGGDALLRGGDFLPGEALRIGPSGQGNHGLRTQMRGFEDASWYTTRQANLLAGVCISPSARTQLELFTSAGAYASGEMSGRDVVRHATGAAMQMRRCIAGMPVCLRYQVAVRHQGIRQPVLHMVTASL